MEHHNKIEEERIIEIPIVEAELKRFLLVNQVNP